jgi:RNA polymerase sigma-70 factor (ECF subfamily)
MLRSRMAPLVSLTAHQHLRVVPSAAEGEKPPIVASDEDLVLRAQCGDRDAEQSLYRRHFNYIGAVVGRLVGGHEEADDIVQETFLIALEQIARLRDPGAFRGWLARIAVSRVRRRFRRQKLLRFLGFEAAPNDEHLAELAIDRHDAELQLALVALSRILNRIPIETRIAWSLRHIEGHSLEEVADACGCSLATAKRRISAAQRAIQSEIVLEEPSS